MSLPVTVRALLRDGFGPSAIISAVEAHKSLRRSAFVSCRSAVMAGPTVSPSVLLPFIRNASCMERVERGRW